MTTLFASLLPSISLRSVLAHFGLLAVGMAALLNSSLSWMYAMWVLALLALAWAAGNVLFHNKSLAFWRGFLIAGGIYAVAFAVASQPLTGKNSGETLFPLERFPTDRALVLAYDHLPDSRTGQRFGNDRDTYTRSILQPGGTAFTAPYSAVETHISTEFMAANRAYSRRGLVNPHIFITTGHALWVIVLAEIGGVLATGTATLLAIFTRKPELTTV